MTIEELETIITRSEQYGYQDVRLSIWRKKPTHGVKFKSKHFGTLYPLLEIKENGGYRVHCIFKVANLKKYLLKVLALKEKEAGGDK